MTIHVMKSWPWFFQAMVDGNKKHDFRKTDRVFKIGDTLVLEEFDPRTGIYTGRDARFKVTYITSRDTPCALSSNALADNHVVLSVEKV